MWHCDWSAPVSSFSEPPILTVRMRMAFFPPSLRFGRPVRFFFFFWGLTSGAAGVGASCFFRGPCRFTNRFGRLTYSRARGLVFGGLGMVEVVVRRCFLVCVASGWRVRFLFTAGTGCSGTGSAGKGRRMS